jgi:hypothetical protein
MKKVLSNIKIGTDVTLDASLVEHPFYPRKEDKFEDAPEK